MVGIEVVIEVEVEVGMVVVVEHGSLSVVNAFLLGVLSC